MPSSFRKGEEKPQYCVPHEKRSSLSNREELLETAAHIMSF